MRNNKIKMLFLSSFILFLSAFLTTNQGSAVDDTCSDNEASSNDDCIQEAFNEMTEDNEDLFTLNYTFEVTGVSGGVGGDINEEGR